MGCKMEIIEIIKAVIYGIVEGITEWLPISSTGHLILVEELIPFDSQNVGEDFFGMFDVVIQLGAILAVVVLFWGQIWPFALTRRERGARVLCPILRRTSGCCGLRSWSPVCLRR